MNSAIVGASGFIGSALAQRLRSGGDPVVEYTRMRPLIDGHGRVDTSVRDCDVVYWLSSSCTPASAEETPALASAELAYLERALGLLGTLPRPPRFVFASSGGTVYSNSGQPPFHESSTVSGTTVYSRLKVDSENAVARFPGKSTTLRISNPYGPGQSARRGQGVVAYWCREIMTGGTPVLLGSSSTQRDYVYIDDLTIALQKCGMVTSSEDSMVLNLGSGVPCSLAELADHFRSALSVDIVPQAGRRFDAPSNWLDIGRAKRVLQWAPSTHLKKGLRHTFDWWGLEPLDGFDVP